MRNNGFYKLLIVVLLVLIAVRFIKTYSHKKDIYPAPKIERTEDKKTQPVNAGQDDIDKLTKEEVVVSYFKQYHRLPGYYITKREARKNGWDAAAGNLCEVLPGRAIGGDVFSNREGSLPAKAGRVWYEADLDYDCAHRNASRLLYSNDGLLFVTKDHYKTFVPK